jgi:methyl-accepting chemotaxis protein
MVGNWSFGRKLGTGFALTVFMTVVMGVVAAYSLQDVSFHLDRAVVVEAPQILDAERLQTATVRQAAAVRGYLLDPDVRYTQRLSDARTNFAGLIARFRGYVRTDEGRRQVENLARLESDYREAANKVIALRRNHTEASPFAKPFDDEVLPKQQQLSEAIEAFVKREQGQQVEATKAATGAASSAIVLVAAIAAVVVVFAVILATFLTRLLSRQIGSAISHVQSSSAELQAASNQQAGGAREQATAMSEITTTIGELLATSRQIAESAQRVAQIAEQTAGAADNGDGTVTKAYESIAAIQRQVELLVGHMLDLGKKSQQIGVVLEIVSELAEQTNILAINATIEAAGAGEIGGRFAVVADEIRKLADRVAESTKEIRGLIDDVRTAVNTTVMTTETGSKAVEAGSKQFAEVTNAFKKIAGLVSTTTDAAREIELSTKQQASAIEQVSTAVSNIAQASKETESSSTQTQQTASELAGLSNALLQLVRPQKAA